MYTHFSLSWAEFINLFCFGRSFPTVEEYILEFLHTDISFSSCDFYEYILEFFKIINFCILTSVPVTGRNVQFVGVKEIQKNVGRMKFSRNLLIVLVCNKI